MRKLALLFTVLALFLSCTKFGKNITVRGRVMNPITGSGFEGVTIQLQKVGKGLPAGYETVKETTTDATGYFEMDHLGGTKPYHLLVQSMENYYRLGWVVDAGYQENVRLSVTKGKKMNVVYHAVPYGRYSLDINNVNCGGASDTIIINQQNQVGSLLDKDWVLTGCAGYQTTLQDIPMGYIYINWTVIRGGVSESFADSVYIDKGTDVVYVLDY